MARAARRARRQALRAGLLVAALAASAAAGWGWGCANTGEPPGGPPDEKPPVILSVYPESGAVIPDLRDDAVIQFDGVIEEQGGGNPAAASSGGLASRILLSPTVGDVKVSWHRTSIHVKPKEGWKPGRVYQLHVLPGIADLRRNILKEPRTIVFSTGPEIPHAVLSGVAVQWAEQRSLAGGLIRAMRLPDTAAYLAVVDSAGAFRLDNLPPGRYAVFAVADQNGNRLRDRREAYDSTFVTLDSTATVVLWTFVHDTLGPRLRLAEPVDSITARLTFSQPLDPSRPSDSLGVRVLSLPDSTPLAVGALLTPADYDSLIARERAAADSIRAARDTTRRDTTARPARPDTARVPARRDTVAPPPKVGPARPAPGAVPAQDTSLRVILRRRPVPYDKLVLRVDTLFIPGEKYYVEVRGARNLNGATADGHAVLVIPKRPPPVQRPDSARAAKDSTRQ